MKLQKVSILQAMQGAINEHVDYEMKKVIDNILDINTEAKKKRKIVVTLELTPDEDRSMIGLSVSAKATLAPTMSVSSSLVLAPDENGEVQLAEWTKEIPGQMDTAGNEAPTPAILRIAQQG